jgi:hypothetical protein
MFGSGKRKNELLELLDPVQKRLFFKNTLLYMLSFSLAGTGIGVVILIFSRFMPIPYSKEVTSTLIIFSIICSIIYSVLRKPELGVTAAHADRYGALEEKVTTALEHQENSSRMAIWQREDAIDSLRKKLPSIMESIRLWSFGSKKILTLLGLSSFFLFLLVFPNPMDDVIQANALELEVIASVEENIEEELQEVDKNEALQKEQKKSLAAILEGLKQDIQEKDPLQDKLNAIDKANKELSDLQTKEGQKQKVLEQLQQKLAENDSLKDITHALSKDDQMALLEAMKEVSQRMSSLSNEEKEELASLMEDLAEEVIDASQEVNAEQLVTIAERLKAAAEAMREGNLPQSFEDFKNAILAAQQQNAQSQQLAMQAAQMVGMLQQSHAMLANANPSSAGTVTAGTGSQGGQGTPGTSASGQGTPGTSSSGNTPSGSISGQANGNSSGNGNGSRTGQGSGNGSGSGSGQGSGSGSGSGNGSGTGSGGNGSGQGSGAGLGQGSRQLVTVPSERFGSDGASSETVGGPLGEGSSESRWSTSSQVSPGVARPYEEVFQQYEQFARENMERNKIPADYEQMVKEYFSQIEP